MKMEIKYITLIKVTHKKNSAWATKLAYQSIKRQEREIQLTKAQISKYFSMIETNMHFYLNNQCIRKIRDSYKEIESIEKDKKILNDILEDGICI